MTLGLKALCQTWYKTYPLLGDPSPPHTPCRAQGPSCTFKYISLFMVMLHQAPSLKQSACIIIEPPMRNCFQWTTDFSFYNQINMYIIYKCMIKQFLTTLQPLLCYFSSETNCLLPWYSVIFCYALPLLQPIKFFCHCVQLQLFSLEVLPKSAILAFLLASSRTFSGLRSLWTTMCLWQ